MIFGKNYIINVSRLILNTLLKEHHTYRSLAWIRKLFVSESHNCKKGSVNVFFN